MTTTSTTTAGTRQAAPRPRAPLASARYCVCLATLICAAVGLKYGAAQMGLYTRKLPLPLLHPLDQVDWSKLGPRYELNRAQTERIGQMSEDMEDELGTTEHAQVFLTDTTRPANDPTSTISVFLTYYTGRPDLVPHVPDACFHAAGYETLAANNVLVPARGIGAPDDRVPVRVLEMRVPAAGATVSDGKDRMTICYFFHANGDYRNTRNGVRQSMANLHRRYAYYSKIEISFNNGAAVRADREASVAALGPLLERLMPVLLTDHFDMRTFESAGGSGPH
jgi:hypothetical protein